MRESLLVPCAFAFGCLSPVAPPYQPVYHNPIDVLDGGGTDGGPGSGDGGPPSGPTYSQGSVGGRSFNLSSAVVRVEPDAGASSSIWIADVPDLCLQLQDGGLALPWNLLQIHLAGATSGTYPVATVLPPGGATARLDWQSAIDAFGFDRANSGDLLLFGIDPANQAPATGEYQLQFGDAGSLTGHFEAHPCPVVPATL
jgi:hypothetical protein